MDHYSFSVYSGMVLLPVQLPVEQLGIIIRSADGSKKVLTKISL